MVGEPPAIEPVAAIGVIGGGQLGRMLALAAARLGFDTHIYATEAHSPAARVAARETVASLTDAAALAAFADACAVITYEMEQLPAGALAQALPHAVLRPGLTALRIAQDRLEEKRFAAQCGARTAPYAPISAADDLAPALAAVGTPAILKTRRDGYDGKGQRRIAHADDLAPAWAALGNAPCLLEGVVAFEREVSLILARGVDGTVAAYPLTCNVHENGILRQSIAPDIGDGAHGPAARAIAQTMADALEYVGVLGVEFFLCADGLVVNEIAPRVHNSGHWTMEGAWCDQFEQHIRAITGWPLGDPGMRCESAVMTNVLGADANDWPRLAGDGRVAVHNYAKGAPSPGRKMGHWTECRELKR